MQEVEPGTAFWIDAYKMYQRGSLPYGIPLHRQTNRFIQMMRFIESLERNARQQT